MQVVHLSRAGGEGDRLLRPVGADAGLRPGAGARSGSGGGGECRGSGETGGEQGHDGRAGGESVSVHGTSSRWGGRWAGRSAGACPGTGVRGREGGVLATATGALRYPGQALFVPAGPGGCGTASVHVHAVPRELTYRWFRVGSRTTGSASAHAQPVPREFTCTRSASAHVHVHAGVERVGGVGDVPHGQHLLLADRLPKLTWWVTVSPGRAPPSLNSAIFRPPA